MFKWHAECIHIAYNVTNWKNAKSRKCRGVFKMKSREKTRQVRENLSQQLEHKQVTDSQVLRTVLRNENIYHWKFYPSRRVKKAMLHRVRQTTRKGFSILLRTIWWRASCKTKRRIDRLVLPIRQLQMVLLLSACNKYRIGSISLPALPDPFGTAFVAFEVSLDTPPPTYVSTR